MMRLRTAAAVACATLRRWCRARDRRCGMDRRRMIDVLHALMATVAKVASSTGAVIAAECTVK